MEFNVTLNNISVISWRSVLLVEETGVPRDIHRHVASHWQTLSYNGVSSTPRHYSPRYKPKQTKKKRKEKKKPRRTRNSL